jgi:hypothetical protein
MELVGLVARMMEKRNAYTILVGIPEERDNLQDIGVNGKIILKCIFKN